MKKDRRALVVDDEPKILEVVSSALENHGFIVFKAENGGQALRVFEREDLSIVLLDLMLPDISGEELCAKMRETSRVPIIMLTAKADEEDILKGLDTGADDYITKPFSLKVLRARVDAVLRRTQDAPVPREKAGFRDGDLEIDFVGQTVIKAGCEVKLTPSEYKILSSLARYRGKVFTREDLITIVFGDDFDGYDRTVDSHIKNLRHKIETNPKNPVYIITVHGIGYKFGGVK